MKLMCFLVAQLLHCRSSLCLHPGSGVLHSCFNKLPFLCLFLSWFGHNSIPMTELPAPASSALLMCSVNTLRNLLLCRILCDAAMTGSCAVILQMHTLKRRKCHKVIEKEKTIQGLRKCTSSRVIVGLFLWNISLGLTTLNPVVSSNPSLPLLCFRTCNNAVTCRDFPYPLRPTFTWRGFLKHFPCPGLISSI